LKKGDTIVHSLPEGPVASAVAAIAKELGATLTSSAETTNAQLAIIASPGSSKLAKALGPKGAAVAYSSAVDGVGLDAGLPISISDAIFNGVSVIGFDLAAWVASADQATITAGQPHAFPLKSIY